MDNYIKEIKIKGKIIPFPIYIPDATRAVVRSLDSHDLRAAGVEGFVVNTYHLMSQPGTTVLEKIGGGFRYDFVVAKTLKSQVSHDINRVFTIYFPSVEAKNSFFSDQEYLTIREKFFDNSVTNTAFIAEYENEVF